MPPAGRLVTPKERRFFAEGEPILVRWDGPLSRNLRVGVHYASSKLYVAVVDCSRLPAAWLSGSLSLRDALNSTNLTSEIVHSQHLRRFYESPLEGTDKPGYYALVIRVDSKFAGAMVADPEVELLVRVSPPYEPLLRFPDDVWAGDRVVVQVDARFSLVKARVGFALWKQSEDIPVTIPLHDVKYIEIGTRIPCMFEPGTWKLCAVVVDADRVFCVGTFQKLTARDPAFDDRALATFGARIARALFLGAEDSAWTLDHAAGSRWIPAERLTCLRPWVPDDALALDETETNGGRWRLLVSSQWWSEVKMDNAERTRWKALSKYLSMQERRIDEILVHFDDDEAALRVGIAQCDEFLALVAPITKDDASRRSEDLPHIQSDTCTRLTLKSYQQDPKCQAASLLAYALAKPMKWVDSEIGGSLRPPEAFPLNPMANLAAALIGYAGLFQLQETGVLPPMAAQFAAACFPKQLWKTSIQLITKNLITARMLSSFLQPATSVCFTSAESRGDDIDYGMGGTNCQRALAEEPLSLVKEQSNDEGTLCDGNGDSPQDEPAAECGKTSGWAGVTAGNDPVDTTGKPSGMEDNTAGNDPVDTIDKSSGMEGITARNDAVDTIDKPSGMKDITAGNVSVDTIDKPSDMESIATRNDSIDAIDKPRGGEDITHRNDAVDTTGKPSGKDIISAGDDPADMINKPSVMEGIATRNDPIDAIDRPRGGEDITHRNDAVDTTGKPSGKDIISAGDDPADTINKPSGMKGIGARNDPIDTIDKPSGKDIITAGNVSVDTNDKPNGIEGISAGDDPVDTINEPSGMEGVIDGNDPVDTIDKPSRKDIISAGDDPADTINKPSGMEGIGARNDPIDTIDKPSGKDDIIVARNDPIDTIDKPSGGEDITPRNDVVDTTGKSGYRAGIGARNNPLDTIDKPSGMEGITAGNDPLDTNGKSSGIEVGATGNDLVDTIDTPSGGEGVTVGNEAVETGGKQSEVSDHGKTTGRFLVGHSGKGQGTVGNKPTGEPNGGTRNEPVDKPTSNCNN